MIFLLMVGVILLGFPLFRYATRLYARGYDRPWCNLPATLSILVWLNILFAAAYFVALRVDPLFTSEEYPWITLMVGGTAAVFILYALPLFSRQLRYFACLDRLNASFDQPDPSSTDPITVNSRQPEEASGS